MKTARIRRISEKGAASRRRVGGNSASNREKEKKKKEKNLGQRGQGTIDFPACFVILFYIPEVEGLSERAILHRARLVRCPCAAGQMSFATRDSVLKNTRFKGLQYEGCERRGLGISKNRKQKHARARIHILGGKGEREEWKEKKNPTKIYIYIKYILVISYDIYNI